jgi:ketosteroid isomerase-like protein
MRRSLPFAAIAGAVLLFGCTPARFDATLESRNLLARDREWADAASAGTDVEKIVSYWSDDAVVIPQGQPIVQGKAAIRAFVTSSLQIPGFKIHWMSDSVAFSPDGKLAYMRSTNAMTVPGPDGKPITLPGRAVTVWRLEPDGQWRCVMDIWNDPPASPAATPAN